MPEGQPLLSEAEAQAVRAAVARAEAACGAEIVPVVVAAADDHELVTWKGAALGALAGMFAAALVAWIRPPWAASVVQLLAPVGIGALAGALAAQVSAVRRALVGRRLLEERVERAAHEAFLRHEVFRTRDRTGLLIFVALFEHEVCVLADTGLHAAVPAELWRLLAREVAGEIPRRAPGAALLAAVERAAALLGPERPPRRADDVNELPDVPVEGER